MGIFDPIKKLLFGVKSVTKHQAEQAADYTKDKGEELLDKTIDLMKGAGEKIGKTGARVLDKVDDLWESRIDPRPTPFQDPSAPKAESDFVEPIRKKMDLVEDKLAATYAKAKEEAKEISGKVVEATDDFWKKAESFSENIVDKARTKGTELYEKAKTVAEEQGKVLNQKIDDFIEKEKAIEAKEPKGEFADTPITSNKNLTEPLMGKHEDFFDKAKKFLDDADKKTAPKAAVPPPPVEVPIKKVNTVPPPSPEKPLAEQDKKQLNDLLTSSIPPTDIIEDADIVDDSPQK